MINQQTSANEAIAAGRDSTRKRWHTPALSVFKAEEAEHGHTWNFDGGNVFVDGSTGHS